MAPTVGWHGCHMHAGGGHGWVRVSFVATSLAGANIGFEGVVSACERPCPQARTPRSNAPSGRQFTAEGPRVRLLEEAILASSEALHGDTWRWTLVRRPGGGLHSSESSVDAGQTCQTLNQWRCGGWCGCLARRRQSGVCTVLAPGTGQTPGNRELSWTRRRVALPWSLVAAHALWPSKHCSDTADQQAGSVRAPVRPCTCQSELVGDSTGYARVLHACVWPSKRRRSVRHGRGVLGYIAGKHPALKHGDQYDVSEVPASQLTTLGRSPAASRQSLAPVCPRAARQRALERSARRCERGLRA